MKKVLFALLTLVSLSTFAKSFSHPTWEGKPFQSSKRLADIACHLLTINSAEKSHEALSFKSERMNIDELPEVESFNFSSEYVGFISKQSDWFNVTKNGQIVKRSAQVLIEPMFVDHNETVKVISSLKCKY